MYIMKCYHKHPISPISSLQVYPPPLYLPTSLFFDGSLSPVSTAHMYMDAELSTQGWETYHWPHPQRRTIFLPSPIYCQ